MLHYICVTSMGTVQISWREYTEDSVIVNCVNLRGITVRF